MSRLFRYVSPPLILLLGLVNAAPAWAAPTFVAAGTVASGTGAITPALPAGLQANDILLLFVETANQACSITNQNGGTWTQVSGSPQSTGGTRLTAFWSRYNGTQGAPTVGDSGDHQLARMIAVRGAATSGDPWNVTAGGVEATSDTSGSVPGATTTVANTLVVVAIATDLPDASSTAKFSGWTNADLASLTERTDNTANAGNGGGLAIATGGKASAGAYGNTAVTLVNAAVKGMMSIAIKPYGDSTPPAAVTDPVTSSPTSSSITLTWTAPGDDGSTGTATSYDIRYSTSNITEGNWASATQVTGEPTPAAAGTQQSMTITNLNASTTYYFAVETADEVPNWSGLSNVPSGTTIGGGGVSVHIDLGKSGFGVGPAAGYTLLLDTNRFDNATEVSLGSGITAGYLHAVTGNWDYRGRGASYSTLLRDFAMFTSTSVTDPIEVRGLSAGTYTLQVCALDPEYHNEKTTFDIDGNHDAATYVSLTIDNTLGEQQKLVVFAVSAAGIVTISPRGVTSGITGVCNGFDLVSGILDNTPPAAVTDLATSNPATGSIMLAWTAPGNDGNSGTAADYDIRYSTTPITAVNWASAAPVSGAPAPMVAGTIQSMTVSPLSADTTYYFAMKTSDAVPNTSDLSNVRSGKTLDMSAPAAVTNLAAGSPTSHTITLTWTAPGDNASAGTATSYSIRYSKSTINDANWASAFEMAGPPSPAVAGTPQSAILTGLSPSTTYYFAMKTSDEVPNVSALSNVISATTAPPGTLGSVALIVEEHNSTARTGEVISGGVPFAVGDLASTSGLRVEDSVGNAVPAQFQVLNRWWSPNYDNSIKWLQVIFPADVAAGGTNTYYLKQGTNVAPAKPVSVTANGSLYTVDTGVIKAVVNGSAFKLFDQVWYDANSNGQYEAGEQIVSAASDDGLVITSGAWSALGIAAGDEFRSAAGTATVTVEESGPVRAVLCVQGTMQRSGGAAVNPYYEYTIRLYFSTNSPVVRSDVTLRNNRIVSGTVYSWPIEDMTLRSTLSLTGSKQYALLGQTTAVRGTVGANMVKLYQDSSGISDWQSSASCTFQNGVLPDAGYGLCRDNWISAGSPTTNCSADTSGNAIGYSSGIERSLIRFDVRQVPAGATVTSASLKLKLWRVDAARTLEAYQILRDWECSSSTWNLYQTYYNWTTAGCAGVGTDRASTAAGSVAVATSDVNNWITIPLSASLVQGWVDGSIANYGLLLKVTDESAGEIRYYPDHSTNATDRPQIVVNYTSPRGVTFRGYRTTDGSTTLEQNNQAKGWIDLNNGTLGVAAGVKQFWQQYPKGLRINGSRLEVALLPTEWSEPFALYDGSRKMHEVVYDFHAGSLTDPQLADVYAKAERPLHFRCQPQTYVASKAWDLGLGLPSNPPVSTYDRYATDVGLTSSCYGWDWFGQIINYNAGGMHPNEGSMFMPFVLWGDWRAFERGEDSLGWSDLQAVVSYDQFNLNTDWNYLMAYPNPSDGGMVKMRYPGWYNRAVWYRADSGHCAMMHTLEYYYLTGDKHALAATIYAGQMGVYYLWPRFDLVPPFYSPYNGNVDDPDFQVSDRYWGVPVFNLVQAYEATGDAAWLNDAAIAVKGFRNAMRTSPLKFTTANIYPVNDTETNAAINFPPEVRALSVSAGWTLFETCLTAKSAGLYYLATGDMDAYDVLVAASDFLSDYGCFRDGSRNLLGWPYAWGDYWGFSETTPSHHPDIANTMGMACELARRPQTLADAQAIWSLIYSDYWTYMGYDMGAATNPSGDQVPPVAVGNLVATPGSPGQIICSWTAPGDDNNLGTAAKYQLKYSISPIVEKINGGWPDMTPPLPQTKPEWQARSSALLAVQRPFVSAINVLSLPAPAAAGTPQSKTVTGLTSGTRYYFAIKTIDAAGNLSDISNVIDAVAP